MSIQTVEAVIQPGMSLVLYTDGVTEARNALGLYGERRLFDAVTRHAGTAHNLASGILDEVLTYQDGHARDDTAILVARLPGPKV